MKFLILPLIAIVFSLTFLHIYHYYYTGKFDSFDLFQFGITTRHYDNIPDVVREYDPPPFINNDSTYMIKDDSIVRGIAPRVDTIKFKLTNNGYKIVK